MSTRSKILREIAVLCAEVKSKSPPAEYVDGYFKGIEDVIRVLAGVDKSAMAAGRYGRPLEDRPS